MLTVRSDYLRAVQACVAGRDDPRAYLQNVYMDPAGLLVATNGSTLITVPITGPEGDRPAEGVMFVPVKVSGPEMLFDLETSRILAAKGPAQLLARATADTAYLDWRRVVPSPERKTGKTDCIGVDPRLLAPIAKALNTPCALRFGVEPLTDPIIVDWFGHPDVTCVVMPCRF